MSSELLQAIDPLSGTEWDSLVDQTAEPQFFHYSSWAKTLIDTYSFKPLFYSTVSEKSCTMPFIQVKSLKGKKKAIALPFSDGCDIVCKSIYHEKLVNALLGEAKRLGLDTLEFRGTETFAPLGEPSHSYWGHRLDLTVGEKKLWADLASSTRRNIRKAQKESVSVAFHDDLKSVHEFYRLHCITRKRHGLPPQPIRFFDNIHKHLISGGKGKVALATAGGKVVAGAVYLFTKKSALFKFGASDKNQQHFRANDLVMWEAIRSFSEKGYKVMSFGKTEKYHEGLCRYKEGFGGVRVQLNDHVYDVSSGKKLLEAPSVHGIHNKVFRRMPISILRFCGEMLYRYSA